MLNRDIDFQSVAFFIEPLPDFFRAVTLFQIISSIGSLILGIGTLCLAFKIYKNFDVKKSFKKEQLQAVLGLTRNLYDTTIKVKKHVHQDIGISYSMTFLQFIDLDQFKDKNIFLKDCKPIDVLSFLKNKYNPLLPKRIVVAIKAFDPFHGSVEEKLPDQYISMGVSKKAIYFSYMKNSEFCQRGKLLVNEIRNWLEDHGAKDINLPEF